MGSKLFGGAPKRVDPPPAPLAAPAPIPVQESTKSNTTGELRADQTRKKRAPDLYGTSLGGATSGKKTLLGE